MINLKFLPLRVAFDGTVVKMNTTGTAMYATCDGKCIHSVVSLIDHLLVYRC